MEGVSEMSDGGRRNASYMKIEQTLTSVQTQAEVAKSWCGSAVSKSAKGDTEKAQYAARKCAEACAAADNAMLRLERMHPCERQMMLARKYVMQAREAMEKARACS